MYYNDINYNEPIMQENNSQKSPEKMSILKILKNSLIDFKKCWWKLLIFSIFAILLAFIILFLSTLGLSLIVAWAKNIFTKTYSIRAYTNILNIGRFFISLLTLGLTSGIFYNALAITMDIKRSGKPSLKSFNIFSGIFAGLSLNFHLFFKLIGLMILLWIFSNALVHPALLIAFCIFSIYITLKFLHDSISLALYFPLRHDDLYGISWALYDKSEELMEGNHGFFCVLIEILLILIYVIGILVFKLFQIWAISKIFLYLLGFILMMLILSYGLLVIENFYELLNPPEALNGEVYTKPTTSNIKYGIIFAIILIVAIASGVFILH